MTEITSHRGMKPKTIKKILNEKIKDWLNSIEDEVVRQVASNNVIVTGGSIASMLLGERINDFDIYMRTIDATEKVAKYYVDKFNETQNPNIKPVLQRVCKTNIKGDEEERICVMIQSSGIAGEDEPSNYRYFEQGDASGEQAQNYIDQIMKGLSTEDQEIEEEEKPPYRPVFISQNAITLSNKIQFVIRFYGEPDEIHDNYDFQHAMCSFDYKNQKLDMPKEALECLLSKTLIYRGSLYPICSVFRTKKFIERGWQITAGEMLKMCWQISEIDLTDIEILEEQLTGVDAAYFAEIISIIQESKDAGGEVKDIDSSYVISIIDRVFGV